LSFVSKVNRMIGLYLVPIRLFFRPIIWAPFAFYAALLLLILALLVSYTNPVIYPILSPLVGLTGEHNAEYFGHYPGLYLLLPYIFQWFKLIASLLFECLAIGLTSILFIRAIKPTEKNDLKLSSGFARWPSMFVVWFVISGIIFLTNWFAPDLFRDFLIGSPRRITAFNIALKVANIIVYSIFIYAVPAIAVYGNNILQAFRTTISLFARYPIFTIILVSIPYLLTVPTSFLSEKVGTIVDRFSPGLVAYVLLAGIIVDMIVNFLLTGAVIKLLAEDE